MVEFGFFNSKAGDRKYNAKSFVNYLKDFIGNGIFPNPSDNLQVMEFGNSMMVAIKPGKAWIDGYWLTSADSDVYFNVPSADPNLYRYDWITVQLLEGENDRVMRLNYRTGTLQGAPYQNPADAYKYLTPQPGVAKEIPLAGIAVYPRATGISQSRIYDLRTRIAALIDSVDTATLYNQYQASLNEFESYVDDFKANNLQEFVDWFDNLKETLSVKASVKQLKRTYVTTTNPENVIEIGIPEYNQELDILEIYVNGIRRRQDQFTIGESGQYVTLLLPLDVIGTPVEFVVTKSYATDGLESLADKVLENDRYIHGVKAFTYSANGITDNLVLKAWFEALTDDTHLQIVGDLGISQLATTQAAYVFSAAHNHRVTLDFSAARFKSHTFTAEYEFIFTNCHVIGLDYATSAAATPSYICIYSTANCRFENCKLDIISAASGTAIGFSADTTGTKYDDCDVKLYCTNTGITYGYNVSNGANPSSFDRCVANVSGYNLTYGFYSSTAIVCNHVLTECHSTVNSLTNSASGCAYAYLIGWGTFLGCTADATTVSTVNGAIAIGLYLSRATLTGCQSVAKGHTSAIGLYQTGSDTVSIHGGKFGGYVKIATGNVESYAGIVLAGSPYCYFFGYGLDLSISPVEGYGGQGAPFVSAVGKGIVTARAAGTVIGSGAAQINATFYS